MVFYTDTDGPCAAKKSGSLRVLEIMMASTPLDKIDFEQFTRVAAELDKFDITDLLGIG